jgi:hypothetical protein
VPFFENVPPGSLILPVQPTPTAAASRAIVQLFTSMALTSTGLGVVVVPKTARGEL